MVKGKSNVKLGEVKGLLLEYPDFLKELLHEVVQETLDGRKNIPSCAPGWRTT